MSKTKHYKPLNRERLFTVFFAMAANKKSAGKIRLSALAKDMDVALSDLYTIYPTTMAIWLDFCDHIDQHMLAQMPPLGSTEDKRDVYFDMIMARFDALQTHRDGVLVWLHGLRQHPDLWMATVKRMNQSVALMLDAAGDSPLFAMKRLGLAAIYALTLKTWLNDDTTDMGKTMVALDHALDRGGRVLQRIIPQKAKKAA